MANRVNLKDAQGNLVSVPSEQVNDALSSGFSQPSEQDISSYENTQKYGDAAGMAKAGAAAAARGLTFGLSDQALTKSGAVDPETLQGLKEANPVTSTVGEIGGAIAPIALTGGAGAAVEGAEAVGRGAEAVNAVKGAAEFAPTNLLAKGAHALATIIAPEASGVARTALGLGIGSAAEGAAYGLGNAISDDALGDSQALGEKLGSYIGDGALLGGVAGVGIGAGSKWFGKMFGKGAAEAAADLTGEKAANGVGIATQDAEAAAKFNTPQEISQEAASNLRSDATKTNEAAKEFGFEAQPGMLSDDKSVAFKEGTLYKSPSAAGDAVRDAYETGYKNMSTGVQDILSADGVTADPVALTQEIRDGMAQKVEQAAGPHKQLYDAIEPIKAQVDVTDTLRSELKDSIDTYIKDSALTPSQKRFASEIGDGLGSIDRLDKLESYRSAFQKEANSLVNRDTLSSVAHDLADIMDQGQLNAVENHARIVKNPQLDGLVGQIKASRAAYKEFIDKFKPVAKTLFGNDKIGGPMSFIRKIEDHLTDEKFMSKLFDKKNSEGLRVLSENFPEEFGKIKQLEKSRIYQKAAGAAGSDFNPLTATKEILGDGRSKGMSKQMQAQLFSPDELRKLDLAEHGLNRMKAVRHFNPSDSGTHIAYSSHMDAAQSAIGHLREGRPFAAAGEFVGRPLQELKDAHTYGKLQEAVGKSGAEKISVLSGIERKAQQITSSIKGKANAIFDFTSKLPIGALAKIVHPSDEDHDKAIAKYSEYSNNPEKLVNDLGDNTKALYAFAPNVAGGLGLHQARMVKFLASKAPIQPSFGPLSPKVKPSTSQKAIFNNYLFGVQNPTHIMDKVKEGTLIPADIETLTAVYPKMYQEMQQQVYSSMVDHVNKNGVSAIPNHVKLSLALFLGQDLDQSMTPQSIAQNQMTIMGAPKQGGPNASGQTVRPSQKGLASLTGSQDLLTHSQSVAQRGVES